MLMRRTPSGCMTSKISWRLKGRLSASSTTNATDHHRSGASAGESFFGTSLMPSAAACRVLLTPEFKRRIEVHVRGVEKFGLPDHAAYRHFRSVPSMINHVDGCIAFARSVEPGFAAQMEEAWNVALRDKGFHPQNAP